MCLWHLTKEQVLHLTEHLGNAIVFALEGKATIGYEGKDYELSEGECFRFEKMDFIV